MQALKADIVVPGDKSISHRALIFAAMAEGQSLIENLSGGEDVRSTWSCLAQMGINISSRGERTTVKGGGWRGLREPQGTLDAGNSGTTMRLLMGLIAGNSLHARLTGDDSLRRRPMERVAAPLRQMGATVDLSSGGTAPLSVRGGALKGIDFVSPVASAQLKSSVLLAGLLASGKTSVTEPALSRDHTERLLPAFGVTPRREGLKVIVEGGRKLGGTKLIVPGDPSSAAFWIVAGTLVKGSEIRVKKIALNPTRVGYLNVLKRMGARFDVHAASTESEPIGDVVAKASALKATTVEADELPGLIDEVPILALAATQAEGESRFKGLSELRHKESDRLAAIVDLITALGGQARAEKDDLVVSGARRLKGSRINSRGDHRIAMTALIASLLSEGDVNVDETDCVKISYPGFLDQLRGLHG